MIASMLICLITAGTVFAVFSLVDSALRGKRAYHALVAQRQNRSAPMARIVIVGDLPHRSFSNAAAARFATRNSRLMPAAANCQLSPSVAA